MNAAALLLLYGSAWAWSGQRLLRRVTGSGVHPRLAVTAWLTAVIGALAAWVCALAVLLDAVLVSMWRHWALSLCMKVLGFAGHVGLPREIGSALALTLLAAGVAATTVVSRSVRYAYRRQRSRSREHAASVRMVGTPGYQPGVMVVQARRPVAYCVAGRPATVVITTAALERLDKPQLAAVLAHESAHLTGRHHQLLMVLRAMAAGLPLPLFTAATDAVAGLLEMCADDVAVRRHGAMPLLRGILALAGQPTMGAAALGAAGSAVLCRATRLTVSVPRRIRWRDGLVLSAVTGMALLTPLAVGLACHF
ncbi:M56 family metallopeptidase [Mycobacterium kyorinense]|uniref:Peptidase M48 n=1 Tax=Mycobacterium kyorinense TaxID=487514 RepID=A0A1X1YJZ8_9MYCO|nr:M56 family metallopeptidase [Mycobacterium kyorinense]ORW11402.1 peptidase M48 [Mycobacterium kyorinense]